MPPAAPITANARTPLVLFTDVKVADARNARIDSGLLRDQVALADMVAVILIQ